jgi:hypothetical protein
VNIAIEYLLRNNTQKNFYFLPCSLFLTHKRDKSKRIIVLSLDDNIVKAFQYKFEKGVLDLKANYIVKSEIFTSHFIVNNNYQLLEYNEENVKIAYNGRVHPMTDTEYHGLSSRIFNSENNHTIREQWLWRLFLENKLPYVFPEKTYTEEDFTTEKYFVEDMYQNHWDLWLKWKETFLIENEIATELVFKNAFS